MQSTPRPMNGAPLAASVRWSMGPPLVALLLALAIYSGHRPAGTNVNVLLASLLPDETWRALREVAQRKVQLSGFTRDALPGGLWVFAATLMAQGLRLGRGRLRISLVYLPLLTALFFESLQGFGWTDGRFDPADLVAEGFGGAGAWLWLALSQRPPLPAARWRILLCAASYAILPLADVHR